jgi:hypothetical protein
MSKKTLFTLLLFVIGTVSFTTLLSGCNKDDDDDNNVTCTVSGSYSGTSLSNNGVTSAMAYSFQENNFAVGRVMESDEAVSFGGYRNTCDSVVWSVYYTTNSSYYTLKGKFSNNKNTISGTYNNLTTPADFGVFTISK